MLMVELPAKEYEKLLEESVNLKETVLRQKKEICELKKQLAYFMKQNGDMKDRNVELIAKSDEVARENKRLKKAMKNTYGLGKFVEEAAKKLAKSKLEKVYLFFEERREIINEPLTFCVNKFIFDVREEFNKKMQELE